jgi:non-homologous end joining protein Ku
VREDDAVQQRVVELVRERTPERRRAAAVEQREVPREQRVVQVVEVVGDGLAERSPERAERGEQQRGERQPRPRVGEQRTGR